ncbi:histidine kinase [uncultured Abyssibacter sp.]|uniref:sensor histidine kinase n=1 Tax=uncultured Abyssibacter sp. TaxID=2320202 RepID=UPI0032B26B95
MANLATQRAPELLPDFCSGPVLLSVALITQLVAVLVMFVTQPVGAFFWERFALLSLYLQWNGLCGAAVLCQARSWLSRMPTWFVLFTSYVLLLGVTALLAELSWMLIRVLGWSSMLEIRGRWSFVVGSLGVAAIIVAFVLRYFWVQHQWRMEIQAQAESRYLALQARIRPHFLFNTLNTLSALIRKDPRLAESMVDDLSDLFRVSLEKRHRLVPLGEEMDTARSYLNIEQVRVGDRMHVEWDVPDEALSVPVPVLSLQPLVENAVHHGIMHRDEGGTVRISAELQKHGLGVDYLSLTVVNPVPEVPVPSQGSRLALTNLTERLRIAYDGRASLLSERENDHFRVEMRLPVVNEVRQGVA